MDFAIGQDENANLLLREAAVEELLIPTYHICYDKILQQCLVHQ